MKVLLDACVWGGVRPVLVEAGHEVTWVGDSKGDPGDEGVLSKAMAEGRVTVTLDKDFGELAVVRSLPHAGIVRLVGFSAKEQGQACLAALARYGEELGRGALITVEPGRVRVRPPGD